LHSGGGRFEPDRVHHADVAQWESVRLSSGGLRVRFPSLAPGRVGRVERLRLATPSTGQRSCGGSIPSLSASRRGRSGRGASLITRRQQVRLLPTGLEALMAQRIAHREHGWSCSGLLPRRAGFESPAAHASPAVQRTERPLPMHGWLCSGLLIRTAGFDSLAAYCGVGEFRHPRRSWFKSRPGSATGSSPAGGAIPADSGVQLPPRVRGTAW
jgi:hypothetical protein